MTVVKRPQPITYEKTPSEVLPFDWDWRAHIDSKPALLGGAISASIWTVVSGAGLTFSNTSFTANGTLGYANGGTIGITYVCKNAVTVGVAVLEHFFKISVVEPT